MTQTHLIQRQLLEVAASTREAAEYALDKLHAVWEQEGCDKADALFTALCPNGETRVIDTLEIDLGDMSGDLSERLVSALREELEKQLSPAQTATHTQADYAPPVLYFIAHGRLPWWAPVEAVPENLPSHMQHATLSLPVLATALEHMLKTAPAELLAWVSATQPTAAMAERVLSHFGEATLCKFTGFFYPAILPLVEEIAADTAFAASDMKQHFWRVVWALPTQVQSERQASILAEKLIELAAVESSAYTALQAWAKPYREAAQSLEALPVPSDIAAYFHHRLARLMLLKEENTTKTGNDRISPDIQDISQTEARVTLSLKEEKPAEEPETHFDITSFEDAKRVLEEIAKRPEAPKPVTAAEQDVQDISKHTYAADRREEQSAAPILAEGEMIATGAAGLILLHPYLGRFLSAVGLRDEKGWAEKDSPIRAAQLLHYLATKETEAAEYELLLHKILCGLPIDHPLPRRFEPTPQEAEECEKLLEAVIRHWTMLGKTSPDGLRQTFLRRTGLLRQQGNNWQLHVETSAFDVLLDGLPWGYHLIKLSWMPTILEVQWQ
jgi:hypothetical protein